MIEKLLVDLGFSDKEVMIVSALAHHDQLTAHEVATTTALPRSTVYVILEQLLEKSLVVVADRKGVAQYSLGAPTRFTDIVADEERALRQKESVAKSLVQLLLTKSAPGLVAPRLHFVTGKREIEQFLFDRLDHWRQSLGPEQSWWGYQDDTFVEQYIRWLEHAWATTDSEEKVNLLSNPSSVKQEQRRKIKGRTIRPLPESFEVQSTVWLVGDYVVLVTTRKKPHYCFELRDQTFAANLRLMFELLWHYSETFK